MKLTRREATNRVRSVAHRCGFACAEHGSRGKDLDLVLVPWAEHARKVDPVLLAEDVASAIPGTLKGGRCGGTERLFGRVAFVILPDSRQGGDTWYIDLSILPAER